MASSPCCSQRLAARGFLRQRVARQRLGTAARPSRANVGSGHDASSRAPALPARAWRTTRRASDDAHAGWHLSDASAARGMRVETLFVLETNVDDLSPQIVAYALEEMLAAGALDAWSVAATMKKGRMGSLLCALCDRAHVDTLCEILFQETSSLGVRVRACDRVSLDRSFVAVDPGVGEEGGEVDSVHVKVARLGGETVNAHPEYDECAALARKTDTPLKTVFRRAVEAYFAQHPAR